MVYTCDLCHLKTDDPELEKRHLGAPRVGVEMRVGQVFGLNLPDFIELHNSDKEYPQKLELLASVVEDRGSIVCGPYIFQNIMDREDTGKFGENFRHIRRYRTMPIAIDANDQVNRWMSAMMYHVALSEQEMHKQFGITSVMQDEFYRQALLTEITPEQYSRFERALGALSRKEFNKRGLSEDESEAWQVLTGNLDRIKPKIKHGKFFRSFPIK